MKKLDDVANFVMLDEDWTYNFTVINTNDFSKYVMFDTIGKVDSFTFNMVSWKCKEML